jgi:hypothetical protein
MIDKRTTRYRKMIEGLAPLGESSPPASSSAVNDDSIEQYRLYRKFLLQAMTQIDDLCEDFTGFDFDDEREDLFLIALSDIVDSLACALSVRDRWFNERVTTTEGGGA